MRLLWKWIFLLFLFFVAFYLLHDGGYREPFIAEANADLSWEDRGSLPLYTEMKYSRAYYYELENDVYFEALRKTFLKCENRDILSKDTWSGPYAPGTAASEIRDLYQGALTWIEGKMNASTYFKLANSEPFQIVEDHWRKWYRDIGTDNLCFVMDMVLYRESKYQGKHLLMKVKVHPKKKIYTMLDMKLLGVVSEDQIGLYPVEANEKQRLYAPMESFPNLLLSDEEVIAQMRRHGDQWRKQKEAEYVVSQI